MRQQQVSLSKRPGNTEKPERKESLWPRIILGILILCVVWFIYAVKNGQFDQYMPPVGKTPVPVTAFSRDSTPTRSVPKPRPEQKSPEEQKALADLFARGKACREKDAAQALALFRKAAEQGYAEAQYELGRIAIEGVGAWPSLENVVEWARKSDEAVFWFGKAVEQGHAGAQYELGKLYAEGVGVTRNGAQAVELFRQSAEQGYAEAQRMLGEMHITGKYVARDTAQALDWFRRAAGQGDVTAGYKLGIMYMEGYGVPQDTAQALALFRKAAEQGHAGAQCDLGVMYAEGEGVPRDAAQAVEWFRKAAEQGNAAAQFNLGSQYAEGEGVPRDTAQAVALFRKAAEQGSAAAQNRLGIMYCNGDGVAKDMREAARWFRKAAEQGHKNALAAMRQEEIRTASEEVARADKEADKRLRLEKLMQSARDGDVDAQMQLGRAYLYGSDDLPKDGDQALVWYRKAAEQGNVEAWRLLAQMYHEGDGIPRDTKQAVYWYAKLAERTEGDEGCSLREKIGRIYAEGDGLPRDTAQAIAWYRKAIALWSREAPFLLARIYTEGGDVPRDMTRALLWHHWAASLGSEASMLELGRIYAEGDGVPQDQWLAAAWLCRLCDERNFHAQGRDALSKLNVDVSKVRRAWKFIDKILETNIAMARFELEHNLGENLGMTREKRAELYNNVEYVCLGFLTDWEEQREEEDIPIPQHFRDMADAMRDKVRETRQAALSALGDMYLEGDIVP